MRASGKVFLPLIHNSVVFYLSEIIIGHLAVFSFRSPFAVLFINVLISITSVRLSQIRALSTRLEWIERSSNCFSENRWTLMMWDHGIPLLSTARQSHFKRATVTLGETASGA
jgi:hypothetical protein